MLIYAFGRVNKTVKNKCILRYKNIWKMLIYNAILCMQLGKREFEKKPEELKAKASG